MLVTASLVIGVPYSEFVSRSAAEKLNTPLLMVHAEFCDVPDSAVRHFAAVPETDKHLACQGGSTRFQYDEDPAVIDHAVALAAAWFREHQ